MFCLRVDNCWFVLEERICFKKTSVGCGKLFFIEAGGRWPICVYVRCVSNFFSNKLCCQLYWIFLIWYFVDSQSFRFSLEVAEVSCCNVWWFHLLTCFLCKGIVFHRLVYWEKIFSNSLSIFSMIGLVSVTATSLNGKLLLQASSKFFCKWLITFNPSFSYIIKDNLIRTINFRKRPLYTCLFAIAALMKSL